MGFLELAVIFLITFLVMGPAKSVEMARSAGKLAADLRKALSDMTAATNLSDTNPAPSPSSTNPPNPKPPERPPPQAVPIDGPEAGNE